MNPDWVGTSPFPGHHFSSGMQSLISDLEQGTSISIPRCFLEGISQEIEVYALHGFCDTSKDAYAAMVYLVMKTATSQVVKFVTFKTGVAPMHKQTFPDWNCCQHYIIVRR